VNILFGFALAVKFRSHLIGKRPLIIALILVIIGIVIGSLTNSPLTANSAAQFSFLSEKSSGFNGSHGFTAIFILFILFYGIRNYNWSKFTILIIPCLAPFFQSKSALISFCVLIMTAVLMKLHPIIRIFIVSVAGSFLFRYASDNVEIIQAALQSIDKQRFLQIQYFLRNFTDLIMSIGYADLGVFENNVGSKHLIHNTYAQIFLVLGTFGFFIVSFIFLKGSFYLIASADGVYTMFFIAVMAEAALYNGIKNPFFWFFVFYLNGRNARENSI
jgi:hypothetical protein